MPTNHTQETTTQADGELSDKLWNLEVGTITKTDGATVRRYLDANTINTVKQLIKSEREAAVKEALINESLWYWHRQRGIAELVKEGRLSGFLLERKEHWEAQLAPTNSEERKTA